MTKNVSYRRGRAKEYRIKKKLEQEGFIVTRGAGSHSPFDLIAVHKDRKEVLFIQSKPRDFSKKMGEKLRNLYNWLNQDFKCSFSVR